MVRRVLRAATVGALALLVSLSPGCARPLTQIVLVIESDLSVPVELDRIEVHVLGPSGERVRADTDLLTDDAPSPPYTLGITPSGTRLSPVHIRVVGTRRGNHVVERSIRTEFQAGRSVELVIRLERVCATVRCLVDATCAGGACLDPYVASQDLPPFRGTFRRPDVVPCTGSPGDAELCDGVDQDCDGTLDEGFDLDVDPAHCGVCGNACASGVACAGGSCGDPAVQIVAGESHTCALRASGRVACWGANEVGQLGDSSRMDSAVPVEIAGIDDAVQIGIGERHTCVLERGGALRCWGWNEKGQLGDGTTTSRDAPIEVPIPGVVELGVGYEHSCARTSGGEVWCWGSLTRFDAGTAMLVHEPEPFVVLGIAEPIAIAGGNESTCAIEAGGRVVCWGQDASGRLGDGPPLVDRGEAAPILEPLATRSIDRFGQGYFAIATDGVVWGWGQNAQLQLAREGIANSPSPLALDGVDGATQIGGGREHGCAMTDAWVRCWGADARAQLGRGVTLGGQHAMPSDVVGLPTGLRELAAGSFHTCARTETEVWCWGANGRGQLGDGTSTDRSTPVPIPLP